MSANKYVALITGLLKEVQALVVSTGAPDAGKIVAVDDTGRLDVSVMPVGIVPESQTMPASGNLTAGNLVNIFNSSGTLKARKADASNAYAAHGFIIASVLDGATATVFFEGKNAFLSGMTIGALEFLSDTAGGVTETPPSTAAHIVQQVGTAISATEMIFQRQQQVVLA